MINSIILLATLISYSMVVSQSFMYLIALKNVQLHLNAPTYMELRKELDKNMRSRFKYVVYAALLSNLMLVIIQAKNPEGFLFVTSLVAFACLITDAVLAARMSIPINNAINSWAPDNYPPNWKAYRNKWLYIFGYRQYATIIGFAVLVAGTVYAR